MNATRTPSGAIEKPPPVNSPRPACFVIAFDTGFIR